MRFRDRKLQSSFLARSDRSRLVRLAIALLLIVMAIKVAADPATWVWMFPTKDQRTGEAPSLADVSYDVQLNMDEELRPDEFRSEPIRPVRESHDATGEGSSGESDTLERVEDDTLTLRRGEREAYYRLLDQLRRQDAGSLQKSIEPGASFPAVMTEPAHYRGRTIEIEGTARRILELPAGANPFGFERLYELWVFTPDSGNNPWRVVATELPESLPRGVLDDGVEVRIAGIFFKRQGYETQAHALHVAPLVLAKSVQPVRRATKAITEFNPTPWLIGTVILVAASFAFLFYRFRREDRAFERTTLDRLTRVDAGELQKIADQASTDQAEFFRGLTVPEIQEQPPPPPTS